MRMTSTRARYHLAAAGLFAIVLAACAESVTQPTGRALPLRVRVSTSLQPLVCPTSETASAQGVIGPAGGSIEVRGTRFSVPKGAVPEPTTFTVTVPASRIVEVNIHAAGHEHYRFLKPATIALNFSRCSDAEIPVNAILTGAYVHDVTYSILEVLGGVTDRISKTITFQTGHLSGYIVAY